MQIYNDIEHSNAFRIGKQFAIEHYIFSGRSIIFMSLFELSKVYMISKIPKKISYLIRLIKIFEIFSSFISIYFPDL